MVPPAHDEDGHDGGGRGAAPSDVTGDERRRLDIDADALTAAIVLAPAQASRNRHFALYAGEVGAVARRRAARVRGVLRHVTGAFGPARLLALDLTRQPGTRERAVASTGIERPAEWRLRYRLSRIALERTMHLTESDLAIVRVAIARAGPRVLPPPLLVGDADHARVAALLDRFERICSAESTPSSTRA